MKTNLEFHKNPTPNARFQQNILLNVQCSLFLLFILSLFMCFSLFFYILNSCSSFIIVFIHAHVFLYVLQGSAALDPRGACPSNPGRSRLRQKPPKHVWPLSQSRKQMFTNFIKTHEQIPSALKDVEKLWNENNLWSVFDHFFKALGIKNALPPESPAPPRCSPRRVDDKSLRNCLKTSREAFCW